MERWEAVCIHKRELVLKLSAQGEVNAPSVASESHALSLTGFAALHRASAHLAAALAGVKINGLAVAQASAAVSDSTRFS